MRLLAVIDRAIRRPRSAVVLAAIGIVAAVAVTTLVFGKYELLPNFILGLMLASLGFWTVDTWRRLWRFANGRWEEAVINLGVKRFGLMSWLFFVIVFPLYLAYASQRSWSAFAAVAIFFFIYALFSLPVWLWAGYFWGRTMARFLGIEKPPSEGH